MAVPEGYVALDLVGFTDKGDYNNAAAYMENDLVHVNNSIWRCKIDNTRGVAPAENNNWTIYINSITEMTGIMAKDTSGVLGTSGAEVVSQTLIDAIADRVMTKLLLKSDVVSQIVNDPAKAASMAALYSVNQSLAQLNSDFGNLDVGKYFTATGNNGTIGALTAFKHAKTVWMYGRVDNLLSTEQAVIQCSNPDLRPMINMLGYGMSYTGSSIATDTIPVLVNINATGDISFSSWQAFKLYTQFFIIYPVK